MPLFPVEALSRLPAPGARHGDRRRHDGRSYPPCHGTVGCLFGYGPAPRIGYHVPREDCAERRAPHRRERFGSAKGGRRTGMPSSEESRLLDLRVLQNFVRETKGRWDSEGWKALVGRVRRIGFETIPEERLLRLAEDNRERWLAGRNDIGPPPPALVPVAGPAVPAQIPAYAAPPAQPPSTGAETAAGRSASADRAGSARRRVRKQARKPKTRPRAGMAARTARRARRGATRPPGKAQRRRRARRGRRRRGRAGS